MLCSRFHAFKSKSVSNSKVQVLSTSPGSLLTMTLRPTLKWPLCSNWALFSLDGIQMRLCNYSWSSGLGPSVILRLAFFSGHPSLLPLGSSIFPGSTSGEKTRHGKRSLFLVPVNDPLENQAGRGRSSHSQMSQLTNSFAIIHTLGQSSHKLS